MWKEYNPSPLSKRTGDCAIRAVAKALDTDRETAYVRLAMNGFAMADQLRDMMEDAPDESTRKELQRFIDKIERR